MYFKRFGKINNSYYFYSNIYAMYNTYYNETKHNFVFELYTIKNTFLYTYRIKLARNSEMGLQFYFV